MGPYGHHNTLQEPHGSDSVQEPHGSDSVGLLFRQVYFPESFSSSNTDMASIRMEVRDLEGTRLPKYCEDYDDAGLSVDRSALARSILRTIRKAGQLAAYSVHFFRADEPIGSWSLARESRDAADF